MSGSRTLVAAVMTAGALLVVGYATRLEARFIWKHAGTYRGGLDGIDRFVMRFPWGAPAQMLVAKGRAEARKRTTEGFMKAQGYGIGAVYVAGAPLAAGLCALLFGVRKLMAPSAKQCVDLEGGLVLLDLDDVGHVGVTLPEAVLPQPVAEKPVELSAEERERFRRVQEAAAESGAASMAVSRLLAEEPLGVARRFRRALRRSDGLSDGTLEKYALLEKKRGVARFRASRRVGRRDRKALLAAARAGVPARLWEAREALRRRGYLTPLRERLFGMLAAHPEWPASVDHHGSEPGGLCEHTAEVVLRGVELLEAGKVRAEDEAALVTVLLAHDVGKAVSYRPGEGGFERVDGLHAQNSGAILRGLPEFHEEHGKDAERVYLAVAHEHDREAIPLEYSESCGRLIDLLLVAEGAAVGIEGPSQQLLEDALGEALRRVPEVVKNLNINRTGGGTKPDGVYEHSEREGSVLLVLEAKFREDLGSVLSKESRQALGFGRRRTPGKAHPGWQRLAAALAGVGAIPGKVRGVSVSDDYLVSAKLGKVVFRGMFPLSLGWLRSQLGNELMEALESHWAVRQDFKICGIVTGVTPSAVSRLRQADLKSGKRAA